jgi:hypothetical protein
MFRLRVEERPMSTVTYVNQPAIHKTRGSVPLAGTSHVYSVKKVLWHKEVEEFLSSLFIGITAHVCCGHSLLGDIRIDNDPDVKPDIIWDVTDMGDVLEDNAVDTVLCDPPYNGKFDWNHKLLSELARIASSRIIFQHWFIPAKKDGSYKKAQSKFSLSNVYVWQPRTYFGRVQVISVFDRLGSERKA